MAQQQRGKVDFSRLLGKPAGLAKKPPVLPPGDYPGMIKSFETGESQNEKRTPFVQFNLGNLGWPDSVEPEDQVGEDGQQINLENKSLRIKYYLTDDSLWRLDEFLKSMELDLENRPYLEVLPDLNGSRVTISIKQGVSDRTGDLYNEVDKLGPVA